MQDFIQTTKELIEQYGKTSTLAVLTEAVYNPGSGEGSYTATSKTIKISPPVGYPARYTQGDLTREGLVRCLTDNTTVIKEGYTISYESITYVVVEVSPICAGDYICAYKLTLRR